MAYCVSLAAAQNSDFSSNLPPFGSFNVGDFDTISLQNGNVHFKIPLLEVAQRKGSAQLYFLYDSPLWAIPYTSTATKQYPKRGHYQVTLPSATNSSFRIVDSGVYFVSKGAATTINCNGTSNYSHVYESWTVTDAQGGAHEFPLATLLPGDPTCPPPAILNSGYAYDGSGMYLSYSPSTDSATLFLKDGTEILPSGTIEDTNGNQRSAFSDDLNRTLVTITNGPTVTMTTPSGKQTTAIQYIQYKITDSNGNPQIYELDYQAIDVNTAFCGTYPPPSSGTSGTSCTEITGGVMVVPKQLLLPNSLTYQFSLSNDTGSLQSVSLATGGSISYTYLTGSLTSNTVGGFQSCLGSDTQNGSCRSVVQTRTISQGGSSALWKYNGGTVTDPAGNDQVHSFSHVCLPSGSLTVCSETSVETDLQLWSGSSANGTGSVARKTHTDYLSELGSFPSGTQLIQNVRPIRVTTTLENGQSSKVETDYETFLPASGGTFTRLNPTEKREFDWGGAQVRRTDYTYLHNANSAYGPPQLNIVDRILSVTVYSGTNTTTSAQTTYEYDVYNHKGLSGMSASGATQHDAARNTNYTTRGNVTAVTRLLNTNSTSVTTFSQYDDAGNVIATLDPNGNLTSYDYTDSWSNSACAPSSGSAKAYPKSVTNALSQVTTYTYNSCTGSIASAQDQNDINASRSGMTYSYDLLGRVTQLGFPDSGLKKYCYTDVGGSCTKSASSLQRVTTLTATPSPTITTTTIYDGLGRLSQTQVNSDPDGTVYTQTTYDSLGRVYNTYNPTRCNPPTSACEATWGSTSQVYDAIGRPTTFTAQDGSVSNTTYIGNCVSVKDPAGKIRQPCYDALGHLTQVTEDPSGLALVTSYSYDALDNLTSVVQNKTQNRSFTYDSLSRLVCASNPESATAPCPASAVAGYTAGTLGYTYDGNGNVITKTDARGTVTTMHYDALNRMTSKSYSDGTPPTTFLYDSSSADNIPSLNSVYRLTKAASGGNYPTATYYSYDPMGRIKVLYQCAYINGCGSASPSVWYSTDTYDAAGNLTSYTDGSGEILTQSIDGAGRPWTLSSNWVDSTHPHVLLEADANQGFWPNGALAKAGLGNTLSEGFAYNNRLQPCRMTIASGSFSYTSCTGAIPTGSLLDLTYCYGWAYMSSCNGNSSTVTNNGNLSNWNANGQQNFVRSFAYDSLNRLSAMEETSGSAEGCKPSSSPSNPYEITWTIDAWGNRTGQSPNSGTCMFSQTANAKNQFNLGSGHYDAAGNLVFDGVHQYAYDAENRVANVDGGQTATYVYNAAGQRVAKAVGSSITYYIYGPDGNVVAERDASNNWLKSYIYLGGKLVGLYAGSDTRFIFSDHLGSARLVTLSNGTVEDSMDYLPFGEQIAGGVGTTHKFTGKERDAESGLDNFGARYDASSMGRFMTPDPLMASATVHDPQTWNRYAYALNNPLRYIDPTGMTEENAADCQKDKHCVTVKVNVIYDQNANLSAKQKATFNQTLLQEAKDEYGDAHIHLDVSYTAGGYDDKGNLQGLSKDSLNVIVSNSTPSGTSGVSQVNNGYALTQIDITTADKGTLAHEMAHQFSGDTTGVINWAARLDPTGIVGIIGNAFADVANDAGRALIPVNAADPHIGRADPAGLRSDGFNAGAKQFQNMLNQQAAIRPRQ